MTARASRPGAAPVVRGGHDVAAAYAARSDSELMSSIAKGDVQALGELYDRIAPAAYGLALHVLRAPALAEDAVHDGFISAWRSAPTFDS